MQLPKITIPKLCTPAYVYLVISIVALIMMGLQNTGSNSQYCAGSYSCEASSTLFIFLLKLIYVMFWTWILNLICNSGASIVSWVLVLMPILFMFLLIGLYIISGNKALPAYTQSGFV